MTRQTLSEPLPSQHRRLLLREVNVRIQEAAQGLDHAAGPLMLMCECGQGDCTSTVEVEHDDFERVFSDDALAIVAPGHAAAAS
jgi:hypothetical protein